MIACSFCGSPLMAGRAFCPKCGHSTFNALGVGELSSEAFVDVSTVQAAEVKRIITGGPWDEAWGGGYVPSTTTLMGGSAGMGKTTLTLQLARIFAEITGKPSYLISAEQEKSEIKFTIDRMGLDFKPGQLRVLKEFGVGGSIPESVFDAAPPGLIILDSLTKLCGVKDKDAQLAICILYKKYAVKYKAPTFIICQMQKEGDYAGLYAIQHEVDTLITLDGISDDRKRERIYAQTHVDGDLRELTAWKNRYGPTGQPFTLVMTKHGLTALPKDVEEEDVPRERTGDPLIDTMLERYELENELRDVTAELRERIKELKEREASLAAKKEATLRKEARAKTKAAADKILKPKPKKTTVVMFPEDVPKTKKAKTKALATPQKTHAIDCDMGEDCRCGAAPETIEVAGQKLVKRPKKKTTTEQARAIEGEALKRKRAPMPKDAKPARGAKTGKKAEPTKKRKGATPKK